MTLRPGDIVRHGKTAMVVERVSVDGEIARCSYWDFELGKPRCQTIEVRKLKSWIAMYFETPEFFCL